MGKNFSGTRNHNERNESDLYQTNPNDVRLFIEHNKWLNDYRTESFLEPACGEFAISNVLAGSGFNVISKDINTTGDDFFKETKRHHWIMTNPPYRLANDFIIKCTTIAYRGFFLYMPLDYLHGKERHENLFKNNYFNKFFLDKVHIFTRKSLLERHLREDGKSKTGIMTYAFYTFLNVAHFTQGNPTIHWIDNDENIFKKQKSKEISNWEDRLKELHER